MKSDTKTSIDYHVSEFTYDMAKALFENFKAHQNDDGVVEVITNDDWLYLVRPQMPHNPMCIGKARPSQPQLINLKMRVN